MAMVIVTSDNSTDVLMCEEVHPLHLADEHSSLQIIERIAWAVEAAAAHGGAGHVSAPPYGRLASG